MKAIILAAGRGSRLYPITLDKPKGLLVIGEETILDRLVRQFRDAGIEDIVLVVGYQKECLMNHFGNSVRPIVYEDYLTTNNLHTLWSVKDELNEDVLISFADLVVQDSIIKELAECKHDLTMAIDTSRVLEGTMRVSTKGTKIKNITTTTVAEADGNFIGISKFNSTGCKLLVNEMEKLIDAHYEDYYTIAIDNIARSGATVGYCDISKFIWREIDTKEEYDELQSIYNSF